ncbi:MAG: signal recognition particle-docking protein FtsY [Erysipelotrichaceae bacterium]|nr:signal recognition particle-docking protein FtsY [Solobacterium sp.]MCI7445809.1 signal recognition particle-docking protein FtsY [Solobacterium sp.]MDY3794169.1 signal recognition particle-docking protein FtsY [Erysipelotrichaceae bacterium]MDY4495211.1 signal recognition particle-docking protein FtsY [Erysipelotrichaceae bacterium]MDY5277152.1 signal recognition particle-docking protein FtsY [Erysipelotrichaceae bacterium]
MGFLDSLKQAITGKKDTGKYLSGFAKTNNALGRKLKFITENNTKNKEDFVEQLMITLIESDIGYKTSEDICDRFFKETQDYLYLRQEDVMDILLETFDDIYNEKKDNEIVYNEDGPTVILMVGVNGSGKTSTCAKLAKMYKEQGKKVCLAAADTFRAGAIEQLREWANRLDVDFVAGKQEEDPSSVLVNACRYAKENNVDILLCDTAGRLQTKVNLMAELAKMRRVVGKEIPGAPHNVWMVLDANTGQNGMSQATLFNEVTDLTGIILTKMDGTSKGGIVIAIKNVLGIPVRFITLGETADDIKPFDFDLYLYSIIGDGDVR